MFDLVIDMYVFCCFYNFEFILVKYYGNDIYISMIKKRDLGGLISL